MMPFSKLLDVISRTWIVRKRKNTGKSVNTIPHSYVQRFSQYPVFPGIIGNYLRVAAAYVENNGAFSIADVASHFNVANAMIYRNQRLRENQREHAGYYGDR